MTTTIAPSAKEGPTSVSGTLRIGIDASNIRAGGGVTHLVQLLKATRPEVHGIERVTVWAGRQTLSQIPSAPWLERVHERTLDGSALQRAFWQQTRLTELAEQHCDVLFVPGGTYIGRFRPFVTMSQNLLPFDPPERRRYGLSLLRLKLHLLEYSQSATFRKAAGVIFLTEIAQQVVEARLGPIPACTVIVPHGLEKHFLQAHRKQYPPSTYSFSNPFRVLYVSVVTVYKHQWNVAEAIAKLRQDGVPIVLDMIGPAYPPSLGTLQKVMARLDPKGDFIRYLGPVPYGKLADHYQQADSFVFASTCETFGQILLEAMASGLPIASSNRSAMPEVLGDAGVYFDPERPEDIVQALRALFNDPELRERLAALAHERAQVYSWERCARDTFSFLAEVARDAEKNSVRELR